MTAEKDPQVEHPGRPDPGPEASQQPTASSSRKGEVGATESERAEAAEPEENRFPDEPDTHQESG